MKKKIEFYFNSLWPLNRSLASEGSRESHKILKNLNNFKIEEYTCGRKVYDWKIPKEWNVKEAYISDLKGKKVLNYDDNNLHVLNYSSEVNKIVSRSALKKNLNFNKTVPDAIPYVTSYYKKKWGFCLSYNQFKKLKNDKYRVCIRLKKKNKNTMTISSRLIKGKSNKEIVLQSYLCHPSMAVNELVGPIVISFLSSYIEKIKNRYYSYRLILAPETIGTMSYIKKNENKLKKNFLAGYILTCFGKTNKYFYKCSKNKSLSDKFAFQFFKKNNLYTRSYDPYGSDERQYNTTGIDIPMGCFMSVTPGKFKEYHSSFDNRNIINFNYIKKNINDFKKFIKYIDKQRFYKIINDRCEICISKYFKGYGTKNNLNITPNNFTTSIKWLMHFCDGYNSLNHISKKSGISLKKLNQVKDLLIKKKLLKLI